LPDQLFILNFFAICRRGGEFDNRATVTEALMRPMSWTALEMSVLINALAKESPEGLPRSLSELMANPDRNAKTILLICDRAFASLSPEVRSRVAKHAEALARC
jgi:hypothetical protein